MIGTQLNQTLVADGLGSRVVPAHALGATDLRAWDALCVSGSPLASPFLTPHYTRAVASVRPLVYICVMSRGGHPVGFLPFQFRSNAHRLLGSGERVGEELTDYFGLVARAGVRLSPETVLRLTGLQSLNFTHLDETQLQYGLSGEQPEIGYLMVFDDTESYWEGLRRTRRKFVADTERQERLIQKQFGPLRFTAHERNWGAELDQLMDYKGMQYVQSGCQNLFAVAWKRKLMVALAECKEKTCTGILSTLYAGDTWLASHFGLQGGDILHYWFPVYNPDLSRFSPGRLLLKSLIEEAPHMGVRVIDHGAGDAWYKQQSSNGSHVYYRNAWHRAGLRSLVWRASESARIRLERFRIT